MANTSVKFNMVWVWMMLCASLISGMVLSLGWFVANPGDNAIAGITVDGVPVGGLTSKEIEAYLSGFLKGLVNQPIVITTPKGNFTVSPEELGIQPDLSGIVEKVMAVGRTGSIWQKLSQMFKARRGEIDIPLSLLKDEILLDNWFDGIQKTYNVEPVNARFDVSDGRVMIYPEALGYAVNRQETEELLLKTALVSKNRMINLSIEHIQPLVTAEMLNDLGIKELIAEYTTYFSLRDANRVNNIILAADALNGQILPPGALFSFNQTVGPRVGETGYLEAPVIENGITVAGIGGGVCQVATTLYNVVLLSDLYINVRHPHSIMPTYVPLGMDATVSYGVLDFVFTNNTSKYIYIEAIVNQDSLRIAIYGEKASKYTRLVSELLELIEPGIEEIDDSSLPKGTWAVQQEGSLGYRVAVWREGFDQNQELIRSFVGVSTYSPQSRIIRVGIGE